MLAWWKYQVGAGSDALYISSHETECGSETCRQLKAVLRDLLETLEAPGAHQHDPGIRRGPVILLFFSLSLSLQIQGSVIKGGPSGNS